MTVLPLSVTSARLVTGTRFTNDYKHTRWFKNVTEQNNFFNALTELHTAEQASFIRHDKGGTWDISKNLEGVIQATYLIFDNGGKKYYCFVTGLDYVKKNVTRITFELDVIQTYMFNMNFTQSYVTREHTTRYNNNNTNDPVINRMREGLDYGDMYNTVDMKQVNPYGSIRFLVVVAKQPLHADIERVITPINNGVTQGLTYYIHPLWADGDSPQVNLGASQGLVLATGKEFLTGLFSSVEAVNNVVSIYITEFPGLDIARESNDFLTFNSSQCEVCWFQHPNPGGGSPLLAQTLYVKNVINYDAYTVDLGLKYNDVTKYTESKLLMYPYTVYILTDLKGQQIEVRPEEISGSNLKIEVWGSMGTSNKVSYMVKGMNYFGNVENARYHEYNQALISSTPNLLPVINDYLSAFIQGNANSLATTRDSIVFNGAIDGIANVLSIGSSAMQGNVQGAVQGGIGTVQSVGNTSLQLQAMNAQIKDINNIPPSLSSQGTNTNFDFGNGLDGVFLMKKQLKAEYANVIADYFKMFGYKVNRLKTPNLMTRSSWNYVELVEPNIYGAIPVEHLNIINNVFKNGITLWHVNNMLNYNQTNNEV